MGSYLASRGISARLIGNIADETGVAVLVGKVCVSVMGFPLLSPPSPSPNLLLLLSMQSYNFFVAAIT